MATKIVDRIEPDRASPDDRRSSGPQAAREKFYEGLAASEGRFQDLVDGFAAGQRVLELGCGVEPLAFELGRRGVEVVGIDSSPVAVEKAAARAEAEGLETVSFRVMNAEALEFADATFDGAVGAAVLQRLDVAGASAEMARVLRSDGRAVFIEPLGHNPLINAYRHRTRESRIEFEHPLRWEDFGLVQRFFSEVEIETFHLFAILTSPVAERRLGRPLHGALTRFDRRVLASSERLRWQAWIAVSEFRRPR